MANTIGYGQGAVNNTNGFGKAPTNNTIDFGEVCADSWSPETNLVGGASFSNTQSIETDGVDDHVSVPVPYTTIDARDTFSISCWLKMPSGGGGGVIGKNRTDSYNAKRFTFVVNETTIEINTNSLAFRNTSLSLGNNWINVIVSVDRSRSTQSDRCRVYVNNVQQTNQGSTNFTQIVADTSPLTIGTLTRGTTSPIILTPFQGKIDEVAIWQTALSATDVNNIYNGGSPNDISGLGITGLINWWRFEGTGTTATDSGTGANDGILTNGATRSTDVPT